MAQRVSPSIAPLGPTAEEKIPVTFCRGRVPARDKSKRSKESIFRKHSWFQVVIVRAQLKNHKNERVSRELNLLSNSADIFSNNIEETGLDIFKWFQKC